MMHRNTCQLVSILLHLQTEEDSKGKMAKLQYYEWFYPYWSEAFLPGACKSSSGAQMLMQMAVGGASLSNHQSNILGQNQIVSS